MKLRLIQNLSVNAGQLVVNQILGLGIFYVLSTGLSKDSFGQINLSLAVLLAVFNILSFGIDQLIVKKIAAGKRSDRCYLHLHLSCAYYRGSFLPFAVCRLLPVAAQQRLIYFTAVMGAAKLMFFFSTPFKQAANGMERFKLLASMSIVSNIARCSGVIVLAFIHNLPFKI